QLTANQAQRPANLLEALARIVHCMIADRSGMSTQRLERGVDALAHDPPHTLGNLLVFFQRKCHWASPILAVAAGRQRLHFRRRRFQPPTARRLLENCFWPVTSAPNQPGGSNVCEAASLWNSTSATASPRALPRYTSSSMAVPS